MDSLITAAARALASGDAISALNHIALRNDPPALALRGIAMAQLGDLARAKGCCGARRAASDRGRPSPARAASSPKRRSRSSRAISIGPPSHSRPRRRCWKRTATAQTRRTRVILQIRRLLLIGRLDEAERLLTGFDPTPLLPASRAGYELVLAGIAMRRLQIKVARAALEKAARAAHQAGIAALTAEVEAPRAFLTRRRRG